MMSHKYNINCDYCGKFIKFIDLNKGEAFHNMITPESDISYETFESACRNCVNKYNLQRKCYKNTLIEE